MCLEGLAGEIVLGVDTALLGVDEWEEYLKESSSTDLGTNYWRTGEIRANNLLGLPMYKEGW